MTAIPQVRFDERGKQLPFTEQEVDTLIPLVTEHYAPRRFALCQVVRDDEGHAFDVSIVAWGIESDDSASVVGYSDAYGQRMRGTFQSAEDAVSLLAAGGDLRLAWVDAAD
ncbi:hypothetical protein ACFPM7_10395 [Actinokineospora guangxiensis]|uniref:Large polyvalent protein associated domain-containing protein n=1 Tax=Actinokineospora guangxiensis TaxID=1490288 RepID=A0ABW0EN96_9PSEU